MNAIVSFFKSFRNLHVASQGIKYVGLAAGLCVGFFGKDWAGATEIMTASLATSIATSHVANSQNSNIVAPGATDKIP